MVLRVVLIVLAVGVVLWLLSARSRKARGPAEMPRPQAFARCAHCGVHLPAKDALVVGGVAYCSEAHRLAGPRDRDGS